MLALILVLAHFINIAWYLLQFFLLTKTDSTERQFKFQNRKKSIGIKSDQYADLDCTIGIWLGTPNFK